MNEDEYYNFWFGLTQNPGAIEILLKNTNKIHWTVLTRNRNAIKILEERLEEYRFLMQYSIIDLSMLAENPNTIKTLETNIDVIDWSMLSTNPNAI